MAATSKVPVPPTAFWLRNRVTHKSFQPYVTAIGQAALAWNDLQNALGRLFNVLVSLEATGNSGIALAVWHSSDNDRAQRKMLTAAAKRLAAFGRLKGTALDDIDWLTVEANKVSDARNDTIHSPLISTTLSVEPRQTLIKPAEVGWHPRASKLSKRDILSEFRWCRDAALVLTAYSHRLAGATAFGDDPLPERPRLPNRGQKSRPQRDRKADPSKSRQRPPRSSRA